MAGVRRGLRKEAAPGWNVGPGRGAAGFTDRGYTDPVVEVLPEVLLVVEPPLSKP
jgi:hypothetical protein